MHKHLLFLCIELFVAVCSIDVIAVQVGVQKSKSPVVIKSEKAAVALAELERVATCPVDDKLVQLQMSGILQLRKTVPDSIVDFLSYAAAAGYIACGANGEYLKVKPSLPDADGLQERCLVTCNKCDGEKMQKSTCGVCHGSGRCPIPMCNNGFRITPGLGGASASMRVACSTCGGRGCCPKCNGSGVDAAKCPKCNGSGVTIDKGKARMVYRENIEKAIELCKDMVIQPVKSTGYGLTKQAALRNAIAKAVEKVHGTSVADKVSAEGFDFSDCPYIKGYKIALAPTLTEDGLTELSVGVFVSKYLRAENADDDDSRDFGD